MQTCIFSIAVLLWSVLVWSLPPALVTHYPVKAAPAIVSDFETQTIDELAKTLDLFILQGAPIDQVQTAGFILANKLIDDRDFQEVLWTLKKIGALEDGIQFEAVLTDVIQHPAKYGIPVTLNNQSVLDGKDKGLKVVLGEGFYVVFKTRGANEEVAAYQVDKDLDLDLVPLTVPMEIEGKKGSAQLFVNRAKEATYRTETRWRSFRDYGYRAEFADMFLLDYVTGNIDRHFWNWLILPDGRPVAIDHGRSMGRYRSDKTWAFTKSLVPSAAVMARLEFMANSGWKTLAPRSARFVTKRAKAAIEMIRGDLPDGVFDGHGDLSPARQNWREVSDAVRNSCARALAEL